MRKFHGVIILSVAVEARNTVDANNKLTETISANLRGGDDVAEIIKIQTDVYSHDEDGGEIGDIMGALLGAVHRT